jgi:GT2 family glycosyltransferase
MKKLSISMVLYESDLKLLADAINSLNLACRHAARWSAVVCSLDLINNKPNDKDREAVSSLARSIPREHLAVTLIEANVNGGYGAGNNISIRRHKDANYHLVLNPDVLVKEEALTNALHYMESNPDAGLLTPKVLGFDGTPHYLCKLHPTLLDMFVRSTSLPWFSNLFARRNMRYEMRDHDYRAVIRPVPYPTGCFMLFRRPILDLVGGFDEGYFLHYEDADIGRRVSQISETAYVPSVVILHKWHRDSHRSWRMRWITVKSGLRYWRKWGGLF